MGSKFIDKSMVLDIKPLRCLAPVFPNSQPEMSSSSNPQGFPPFTGIPPTGPFPHGVAPFYPVLASNHFQTTGQPGQHTPYGYQGASGFSVHITDAKDSSAIERQKRRRQTRGRRGSSSNSGFNEELVVNSLARSFKLTELDPFSKTTGDKDLVDRILLVYDLLKRRMTQFEEANGAPEGVARRPNLKAGNLLLSKGIRTNNTKRIGHVPGVEVGDIFFFRMELCLVGMHAPIMAGIDYLSVRAPTDEEPVALSIVASGGYGDVGEDGDVLIYTGHGGVQRPDGQMFDQKLERGNLALEKSVHRGNVVRVIRGFKDIGGAPQAKIYVYDGLYKVQESWAEKNNSGCNIFKYKLVRVPGQPEVFMLWKSIQQWKGDVNLRNGVILPDLTSGAESLPVALVNDVDDEKGPAYFTYLPTLKYNKPFLMPKPSLSCHCTSGCQSSDAACPCVQRNGGYLPYVSPGMLLSYKSLVHECGQTCACPPSCRNRMTQAGLKVRLEVFRTQNRGWGLRSWDPIRAGLFICEYTGEIIDASKTAEFGSENEDNYIFDATRTYEPLEPAGDELNEASKAPFPLVISAKNQGNVARFMNHSCSPNVYWHPVLRETENEAYFHIAFFAVRHIPPMQELTYDYGLVTADRAEEYRRKQCLCGSSKCRGYFY